MSGQATLSNSYLRLEILLKKCLANVKSSVAMVPIEDMATVQILKLLWKIYQCSYLNCRCVTILSLGGSSHALLATSSIAI